jgi:hypothetical protein
MDWKQLLTSVTESVDQELQLRNAYLVAENRLLRQRIRGRVLLSDGDRQALAELGQKLGKQALEEIAAIAKADTILAWHRKFATQQADVSKPCTSVGRPRVDQELEALAVRMTRENRSWGYDRIAGALIHLGYRISDQTVGNILKRHGVPPAPERQKTMTWAEFIHIHRAMLGATDFFSNTVWGWLRLVISCLLVFIHAGRCMGHVADMTASLTAWCADWYVAAKWGGHSVIERGLARLFLCNERSRRSFIFACALHASRDRLSQGMGHVVHMTAITHHQIRDSSLQRRPPASRASTGRLPRGGMTWLAKCGMDRKPMESHRLQALQHGSGA